MKFYQVEFSIYLTLYLITMPVKYIYDMFAFPPRILQFLVGIGEDLLFPVYPTVSGFEGMAKYQKVICGNEGSFPAFGTNIAP